MISSDQLRDLAYERLIEAELMLTSELFQGAYYISGYAVEFALKAVICKRMGVQLFSGAGVEGASIVARAVQIHNIPALMLFSGYMMTYAQRMIMMWSLLKHGTKYPNGQNSADMNRLPAMHKL